LMARAGPKGEVLVPPLDLRRLPASGGARVVAFCERFLTVPKGTGAKRRLKLRAWQRDIVSGLFDDPRPRHGLVAIPRGNGKSTLAAALGLYGLLADGVEGAQVLCVASDRNQAGIVHRTARRMVELDQRLADRVQVYKDRLYVPQTDSVLVPLPAEPGALQGWDPSLAIVDELHVVTDEVYEAMSAAAGKRDRSLVLAISTASGDTDGIMWRLVEQGRLVPDPAFFFREYAAPPSCDLDDEDAWAIANPALDDFLHRDALRSNLKTLRASSFRRFRLGQWVQDHDAWLPAGVWAACEAPVGLSDGDEVVIGLDGSFSQDATALVAVSVAETPHIDVVGLWEPPEGDPSYRVPVADVEEAIRQACRRYQVREIVADPYRWTRSLQALEAEGLPVSEFPQSPSRMTPATTGLYEAVVNQAVTHDGDARLARHIGNCVVRVDSRGTRLAKEHKHSLRRIDLAVAAVMAHSRATWLAGRRPVQLFTFGHDDEA
jgi:phage terminase large subunit-like protein